MTDELRSDAMSVIRSIRRLRLLLNEGLGKRLAESGVNMPQFAAMALLGQLGETTMSNLTRELGTTMGAVTNIIDKLVYAEYVTRKRNPRDRRIVNVTLTPKGSEVLEHHQGWGADSLEGFLSDLTPQDRRTFIDVFGALVSYIDKHLANHGYTSE